MCVGLQSRMMCVGWKMNCSNYLLLGWTWWWSGVRLQSEALTSRGGTILNFKIKIVGPEFWPDFPAQ